MNCTYLVIENTFEYKRNNGKSKFQYTDYERDADNEFNSNWMEK